MTIETRLAEIRARCQAATEGPWKFEQEGHSSCGEPACCSEDWDNRIWASGTVLLEDHQLIATDAEFIAASRTDLPALLSAVEAVKELHKPERRYLPYEGADISYDTAEEAAVDLDHAMTLDPANMPYFDLCAHCKVIEDSPCDGECTREAGYLASLWPCSTITALTAALEAP